MRPHPQWPPPGYEEIPATARRWGVSAQRVRLLATRGRVDGARLAIRPSDSCAVWLVPSAAPSPARARPGRPTGPSADS